MDYKAVFFDFDYTLGDATEAIVAGFQYAFAKMGLPEPEREAVRRTIGMMLEDEYTVLTGDSGPENRARFRKLYTEKAGPLQVESTRLFPGAAELLTALHRQGIPAGIASTKKTGPLRDVLEARGVAHLLTSIVGGDQVSAPKPDPQGLLASVNALGLAPAEVLFCGDTTIDGEAALGLVARVFGEFLRKLAEVGALVDALNQVLRLVFRLHENVTDLVFRVAVGLLVGVVGLLEVGFGNRVLLGPVLSERADENLIAGFLDGVLDVGLVGELGLLGFLKEDGLLNEKVLDLTFELFAGGLALSNGAVVNGLLLGDGNGFPIHLEGLEFSAGGAGGKSGGKAENNDLLIHGCCLKIAEGCRSSGRRGRTVGETESIVALRSLFCHPDGNANCKYHCQGQEPEELEVDPDVG